MSIEGVCDECGTEEDVRELPHPENGMPIPLCRDCYGMLLAEKTTDEREIDAQFARVERLRVAWLTAEGAREITERAIKRQSPFWREEAQRRYQAWKAANDQLREMQS